MTGLPFPDISPIALQLGPLALRWYSLAYLFGILAAWALILRDTRKYNLPFDKKQIEDLVFYITFGIIVGGRLGYALFYGGAEMWLKPWHLLELWKGGMSFHGGICGVIIAAILFARRNHIPLLTLTDLVALYAPIGIFLGRLANFINDELWGRPSDVPWAVRFPRGGSIPRHPSQLYEAFFEGIVLLLVLNLVWRFTPARTHRGVVSGLFILLYALFRSLMELFREPDAQLGFLAFGLTMGQILCLPLFLLGGGVLVVSLKRKA